MISRINSDLSNDLGNLFQRVLTFIYKNSDAKIPDPTQLMLTDKELLGNVYELIGKVRIHFETSGRDEKSPLGPIVDPKPGPTLEIDVAAPEIDVIKSKPLKDNKAAKIKNITKYI